MGKVLTVNEGSVPALEHVHVSAGNLKEDLTSQTGWCRRIRRQDSPIPDLVANQRHRKIGQLCDKDIPFHTWRDWVIVFIHNLHMAPPRRNPQTSATWML